MDLPFSADLQPQAGSVPAALSLLNEALQGRTWASFSLGCRYPPDFTETQAAEARKGFQTELIHALQAQGKAFQPHLPPADLALFFDFSAGKLSLQLSSVFLCGRYNKFSRVLAQTTHFCFKCKGRGRGCSHCKGTGKLSEESVEELLAILLLPAFGSSGRGIFHGAGREDVDVRMLGGGRPFVFELTEPCLRDADLAALSLQINERFAGKIAVHGLSFCGPEKVAAYKEAEHDKVYFALVVCPSAPDLSKLNASLGLELKVEQRTPLRVSKRRADLVRQKYIVFQSITPLPGNEFELTLLASSGLYVKEFISGDEGRSNPSLTSLLGISCACRQLDVLGVVEKAPGQSNV